ncbi:MAG: hypothetical protein GKS06_00210 [Acidobacteria bacterium]|nr:hypothetical protein [Acidobacteriota bacterium]
MDLISLSDITKAFDETITKLRDQAKAYPEVLTAHNDIADRLQVLCNAVADECERTDDSPKPQYPPYGPGIDE